jgi:hypothetical protein
MLEMQGYAVAKHRGIGLCYIKVAGKAHPCLNAGGWNSHAGFHGICKGIGVNSDRMNGVFPQGYPSQCRIETWGSVDRYIGLVETAFTVTAGP